MFSLRVGAVLQLTPTCPASPATCRATRLRHPPHSFFPSPRTSRCPFSISIPPRLLSYRPTRHPRTDRWSARFRSSTTPSGTPSLLLLRTHLTLLTSTKGRSPRHRPRCHPRRHLRPSILMLLWRPGPACDQGQGVGVRFTAARAAPCWRSRYERVR